MCIQEAALLPGHSPAPPGPAPPWHTQQGPCSGDSLACSDQLETATQSLAAICPRSPEDKGVVYHIAKGTGKGAADRPFQHLKKLLERIVSRTDISWTRSHIALTVLEMGTSGPILSVYFSP